MAKPCGAKTRSGGTCGKAGLANGRCRFHGGKVPKAGKPNQRAAKPGSLYSAFLTDEERELELSIELGSVDGELRLMRLRLRRALAAEAQAADEPELDQITDRELGSAGHGATNERVSKRRDYVGIIDRITARIESLERRRLELLLMQKDLAGDGEPDAHEVMGFEVRPYDDEPGDASLPSE